MEPEQRVPSEDENNSIRNQAVPNFDDADHSNHELGTSDTGKKDDEKNKDGNEQENGANSTKYTLDDFYSVFTSPTKTETSASTFQFAAPAQKPSFSFASPQSNPTPDATSPFSFQFGAATESNNGNVENKINEKKSSISWFIPSDTTPSSTTNSPPFFSPSATSSQNNHDGKEKTASSFPVFAFGSNTPPLPTTGGFFSPLPSTANNTGTKPPPLFSGFNFGSAPTAQSSTAPSYGFGAFTPPSTDNTNSFPSPSTPSFPSSVPPFSYPSSSSPSKSGWSMDSFRNRWAPKKSTDEEDDPENEEDDYGHERGYSGWGKGYGKGWGLPWIRSYACFASSAAERPELDMGDKILLPLSALNELTRRDIQFPMLFKIRTKPKKTPPPAHVSTSFFSFSSTKVESKTTNDSTQIIEKSVTIASVAEGGNTGGVEEMSTEFAKMTTTEKTVLINEDNQVTSAVVTTTETVQESSQAVEHTPTQEKPVEPEDQMREVTAVVTNTTTTENDAKDTAMENTTAADPLATPPSITVTAEEATATTATTSTAPEDNPSPANSMAGTAEAESPTPSDKAEDDADDDIRSSLTLSSSKAIDSEEEEPIAYCSVLEFVAPPGTCYLPSWLMTRLGHKEGEELELTSVVLPKGTFVRLKPTSENFRDLVNTKALYHCMRENKVLETKLRHFSVLHKGCSLHIHHHHTTYSFDIIDLKPADVVCIIDTDLNVDFDIPEHLAPESPEKEKAAQKAEKLATSPAGLPSFQAFQGAGWRQGSGDTYFDDNKGNFSLCPNCDAKIPPERLDMHTAVCYRQNMKCPKCAKKIQKSEKEKHDLEFHALTACQCGKEVEKWMMEQHLNNHCDLRPALCPYCDMVFPKNTLAQHQQVCGTRTELCTKCGSYIMLQDLDKHIETNCQFRTRRRGLGSSVYLCPICNVGVGAVEDLQEHLLIVHADKADDLANFIGLAQDIKQSREEEQGGTPPGSPSSTPPTFPPFTFPPATDASSSSSSSSSTFSFSSYTSSYSSYSGSAYSGSAYSSSSYSSFSFPASRPSFNRAKRESLFFCPYCQAPFVAFNDLEAHMSEHQDDIVKPTTNNTDDNKPSSPTTSPSTSPLSSSAEDTTQQPPKPTLREANYFSVLQDEGIELSSEKPVVINTISTVINSDTQESATNTATNTKPMLNDDVMMETTTTNGDGTATSQRSGDNMME